MKSNGLEKLLKNKMFDDLKDVNKWAKILPASTNEHMSHGLNNFIVNEIKSIYKNSKDE